MYSVQRKSVFQTHISTWLWLLKFYCYRKLILIHQLSFWKSSYFFISDKFRLYLILYSCDTSTQVKDICHISVRFVFFFLYRERYFQYSVRGSTVMRKRDHNYLRSHCCFIRVPAPYISGTNYDVSMCLLSECCSPSIPASLFHALGTTACSPDLTYFSQASFVRLFCPSQSTDQDS